MVTTQVRPIFDNLRGELPPLVFCKQTGLSRQTLYNWRYKSKICDKIPKDLFVKVRGKLFVRTDVFKAWVASDNQLEF